MELVDTPDLGSGAARCESSSLFSRTKAEEKSSAFCILDLHLNMLRYNIGTTFCYFEDKILFDNETFHLP